jgi:hypothetical protein
MPQLAATYYHVSVDSVPIPEQLFPSSLIAKPPESFVTQLLHLGLRVQAKTPSCQEVDTLETLQARSSHFPLACRLVSAFLLQVEADSTVLLVPS